jgi:hypothetical protein
MGNQTNVTTTLWVSAVLTLGWAAAGHFFGVPAPTPEIVTAANMALLGLIQYFKKA